MSHFLKMMCSAAVLAVGFSASAATNYWNKAAPWGTHYMNGDYWTPKGVPVPGADYCVAEGNVFSVPGGNPESWYTFPGDSLVFNGGHFYVYGPKMTFPAKGMILLKDSVGNNNYISTSAVGTNSHETVLNGQVYFNGHRWSITCRNNDQHLVLNTKLIGNSSSRFVFSCNDQSNRTSAEQTAGVVRANSNACVVVTGDVADYQGSFEIENGGYPAGLCAGSSLIRGPVSVKTKNFIRALSPSTQSQLSKLTLSSGAFLFPEVDFEFDECGLITVLDDFSYEAPIDVVVKAIKDPALHGSGRHEYPLLRAKQAIREDDFFIRFSGVSPSQYPVFSLQVRSEGGYNVLYLVKERNGVEDAVWTGADPANNLLTTPGNWEDGVLPDLRNGFTRVVFAAGDEAVVPDGVRLGGVFMTRPFTLRPASDGATLSLGVAGVTVTNDVEASILCDFEIVGDQTWTVRGGGRLVLGGSPKSSALVESPTVTIASGGTYDFRGTEGDFAGSWDVKESTMVYLTGENPLGGEGGRFVWTGGSSSAEGYPYVSCSNLVESKEIVLNLNKNGSIQPFRATAGTVRLLGPFSSQGTVRLWNAAGSRFVFAGGVTSSPNFCENNTGPYIFEKPLTVTMMQPDALETVFACGGNLITSDFGLNYIYAAVGACIRLTVPNCFDSRTALTMDKAGETGHLLDLCGNDQTFGTLAMTCNSDGSPSDAVITNSGARAALHIVQSRSGRIRPTSSADKVLCWLGGDIRGPIDFWKEGKAELVVTNAVGAAGDLHVTQGALRFAPCASWLNATNVVLTGNAEANAVLSLTSSSGLSKRAAVYVNDGAVIELAAGVEQQVGSFYLDGVKQVDGLWRHGETYSATARTTPCIQGSGVLRVARRGLFVRLR